LNADRLTEAGMVVGAWVFPGGDECILAAALARLPIPIEGFGSTDCTRCRSHLFYWPETIRIDTHQELIRIVEDAIARQSI
jgi:Uri superfamily endonuclease